MAKFKCLLSGNVIEFTNQVDIDSMVGHSGYEAVVEQAPKEAAVKTTTTKKTKQVEPVQEAE
jgi:hypothetical protein